MSVNKIKDERLSSYAIPGLRRVGMPMSLKKTLPENIIEATCKHFDLSKEAFERRTRKRDIVYARQCAMYLICLYTNLILNDIGTLFGKKKYDHTTIRYSRELIKNRLMVNDGDVKEDIEAIYMMVTEPDVITQHNTN